MIVVEIENRTRKKNNEYRHRSTAKSFYEQVHTRASIKINRLFRVRTTKLVDLVSETRDGATVHDLIDAVLIFTASCTSVHREHIVKTRSRYACVLRLLLLAIWMVTIYISILIF